MSEAGALIHPVLTLLKRVSGVDDRRFVERFPGNLQANRQAATREPARDGDGRHSGEVVRTGKARPTGCGHGFAVQSPGR